MSNYKFDDESKIQPVPIIITEGNYEGLRFQYGRISFDENDSGGCALNFDYTVIDNPNELKEDQELIDTLGKILMDVLEKEMEDTDKDFLREPVEVNEDS